MTFRHPLSVGTAEEEGPECVWEVLVEAEFQRSLDTPFIDRLQERLWERLSAAIREEMGPYVRGSAGVAVYDVRGRGEETPLFPLCLGSTRFPSNLDIVEMVERRCAGTVLAHRAFDARGRAYDLTAEIGYVRRPEHDRPPAG